MSLRQEGLCVTSSLCCGCEPRGQSRWEASISNRHKKGSNWKQKWVCQVTPFKKRNHNYRFQHRAMGYLVSASKSRFPWQDWWNVPVVGSHHEVEQQAYGLLHVDLVCGGQALVQLVVDGRQDSLQAGDVDLCGVIQCVQPIVSEGFDHVPHVHKVNWWEMIVGQLTTKYTTTQPITHQPTTHHKSTNQSMNQSTDQSVKPWSNRLINHSINCTNNPATNSTQW